MVYKLKYIYFVVSEMQNIRSDNFCDRTSHPFDRKVLFLIGFYKEPYVLQISNNVYIIWVKMFHVLLLTNLFSLRLHINIGKPFQFASLR